MQKMSMERNSRTVSNSNTTSTGWPPRESFRQPTQPWPPATRRAKRNHALVLLLLRHAYYYLPSRKTRPRNRAPQAAVPPGLRGTFPGPMLRAHDKFTLRPLRGAGPGPPRTAHHNRIMVPSFSRVCRRAVAPAYRARRRRGRGGGRRGGGGDDDRPSARACAITSGNEPRGWKERCAGAPIAVKDR